MTGALSLPHDESPVELVRDVARYAAAIGLSMLAVTIVMANLFMNVLKRRGLAK